MTPSYNGDERRETVVSPPNNIPYIIAVVLMMIIGVAGIVAIEVLRPDKDNVAIDAALLGFLAPTTVALLAFMKAQETHLSVNSRLDAFMAQARLASRAEGLSEGRKEGRDAANKRTDDLASTSSGIIGVPLQVGNPLQEIATNTKETAETLKEIKEK